MRQILILCHRYLPGYQGGGPIRSVASIVDRLGDEFRFRILTRDRDTGDARPYPAVTVDAWQRVGKAEVCYQSPRALTPAGSRRVLAQMRYDLLYLNSFFNPSHAIMPVWLRRLGLIPDLPVVIAPRGEFSPGALSLKQHKKHAYLRLARTLGLYQGVLWHASSPYEEADIRRHFGRSAAVVVAPNLAAPLCFSPAGSRRREKRPGELRMVFLSRLARKKNLDGALRMLEGVPGDIHLDIYGPRVEPEYWAECARLMERLASRVTVRYRGPVEHDQVGDVLSGYDLFFLPTRGENFGHVILEALTSGCPVLLSDQTPWRDLAAQGAGWDLPLDQPASFRRVLQQCVAMEDREQQALSRGARRLALQFRGDETAVHQTRSLFLEALSRASGSS
jgi:glycosyltransferase involved in cell wall biosynthesis